MIEVRNLVKVYSQNKKKQCRALDGVSFVLPDKGMVFIVGKSGSGKSTLLNVLGGLDKLTGGDIVIDGLSFADFKQSDYDSYHCDYLGFVFQDFCLLDTLTIEENIAVSLQLQGSKDLAKISEALTKLDMEGYGNRYPTELSGGQKQRVAIARALIKNPKLILADEPTGNLDGKTGTQILRILKEISANSLVVVVSHSIADAEKYADRIIELADGKVVSDVSRSGESECLVITDNEISFPKGIVFADEQIKQINEAIRANKDITVKQTDGKFIPHKQEEAPLKEVEKRQATRKAKSVYDKSIFKILLKKRIIGQIITTILVACLIVVLGVCQLFTKFNADEQISGLLAKEDNKALVLQKGYPSNDGYKRTVTDRFVRITDEDLKAFADGGYEGNIYYLYNAPLVTTYGSCLTEQAISISTTKNCKEFYSYESRGVLVCDEQFLTKIYGIDGKLDYVGHLDRTGTGLIITDYLADSILYFNKSLAAHGDGYSNIIDSGKMFSRYTVCAVINTDYRERYKDLIDIYDSEKDNAKALKQKLRGNQLYAQFLQELDYSLNIAYSFNANYGDELKIADSAEDQTHREFARTLLTDIYDENDKKLFQFYGALIYQNADLADDEILISPDYYAVIADVDPNTVDESIIGQRLSFEMYDNGNDSEIILALQDMRIAGFGSGHITVSPANFQKFINYDQFAYALYCDNPNMAMTAYNIGKDNYFACSSQLFNSVYTVAQAVDVFTDMFALVAVVLCVLCAILLISFVLGNIKKSAYEIGVLRALGASNKNIAVVYLVQAIVMGAVIALIAVLGLALGTEFCNGLLAEGFQKFTKNPIIGEIDIINLDAATVAIDIAITLAITCTVGVVPFAVLRKIKPSEIIRSKD